MMEAATGPYLVAALFCEQVLEEKTGVLSVIRIIDRVIQHASGPGAPEQMPPLSYVLTALISLKSGQARGTVQVRLDMESPSGLVKPGPFMTALMEGEDRGQNLVMRVQTMFEEPGLYWFNVHIDDKVVTRMPFRVVYTRIGGPPPRQ